MPLSLRLLQALAGLFGAAGVALAAAASHGGDTHLLGNASLMCLVHAPALLLLAQMAANRRFAYYAVWPLAVGTLIFALDLVSRHFRGEGLAPMAAPSGGMLMIAGWLVFAVGSLWPPRA